MDRVTAMILGAPSIREVIAFPKNRSAFCPLTGAPAPVAQQQLAELGLLDLGGSAALPGAEQKSDQIGSLSWVSRIGVKDDERISIATALKSAARLAGIVDTRAGDEEPLYSVVEPANHTRDGDEAKICPLALNGELLKNAPACKGDYFKVASIIE